MATLHAGHIPYTQCVLMSSHVDISIHISREIRCDGHICKRCVQIYCSQAPACMPVCLSAVQTTYIILGPKPSALRDGQFLLSPHLEHLKRGKLLIESHKKTLITLIHFIAHCCLCSMDVSFIILMKRNSCHLIANQQYYGNDKYELPVCRRALCTLYGGGAAESTAKSAEICERAFYITRSCYIG